MRSSDWSSDVCSSDLGPVDFLHDHRRFGQPKARAAVFVRNQGGKPARLRQRLDELGGIAPALIDFAKIIVGKLRTQIAHRIANVLILTRVSQHPSSLIYLV